MARVKDKELAPRLDTYAYFMNHVAWPETGAWNLNRWKKRGDTAAISKEQLERIKAKY